MFFNKFLKSFCEVKYMRNYKDTDSDVMNLIPLDNFNDYSDWVYLSDTIKNSKNILKKFQEFLLEQKLKESEFGLYFFQFGNFFTLNDFYLSLFLKTNIQGIKVKKNLKI